MSKLRILNELLVVRNARITLAERAIYQATVELEKAIEDQKKAEQSKEEYSAKVRELVDELYNTCIGQKVGREFVEELRQKEMKIYAHEDELTNKAKEAKEATMKAQATLDAAKALLLRQTVKRDNLVEVVKRTKAKLSAEQHRVDQRKMDEMAVVRYCIKV